MKRKISVPVLLVSLTGLFASTAAMAGLQTGKPVVINDSGMVANGELGYVRNTPDRTQYIGCTSSSNNVANCFAVDINGISRTCVTTNPSFLATIRSLNGDSYLVFYWSPTTGQCTSVEAVNDSTTTPK